MSKTSFGRDNTFRSQLEPLGDQKDQLSGEALQLDGLALLKTEHRLPVQHDLLPDALVFDDSLRISANEPEQKITPPEFTESNFVGALKYAADSGKPILAIFGSSRDSDFQNYQKTVLPQLRQQFGDKVVLLVINTATQKGRAVSQRSVGRDFGAQSYTMLLHPKRGGGFDEVDRSRFLGTSHFIPGHVQRLLPQAYADMKRNGFQQRQDSRTTIPPGKPAEVRPETTSRNKEQVPEKVKEQSIQKREIRTNDGTVIKCLYRNTNESNVPNTVIVEDQVSGPKATTRRVAWVPDPTSKEPVWQKFIDQNGKWVRDLKGDWPGKMWQLLDTRELVFQAKNSEKTITWTARGGEKTKYKDGSSIEVDRKTKLLLEVVHNDKSSVEARYNQDNKNKPIQHIEKVKDAAGQLKEVVWTRQQSDKSDEETEWLADNGAKSIGLKLDKDGTLRFKTPDGAQHTVDRAGVHHVFERLTFANATSRELTSTIHSDGKQELTRVKVTTPAGKVYDWKKVGADCWTCNGGKEQHWCDFKLQGEGANKRYVTFSPEKKLRIEHSIPGGEQKWFQTVKVGGATKEHVFDAYANGKVQSILDGATGNQWTADGNGNWLCKATNQKLKGELQIASKAFSFFDKETGDKFTFTKTGILELENRGNTLARFDKLGRQIELISPNGKARRQFKYDGESKTVTNEIVIRPNEKVEWARQKGDKGIFTDNDEWKATSDGGFQYPNRTGVGKFRPDYSYEFNHRDYTVEEVNRKSGEETIHNLLTRAEAVYEEGVLYSIRLPGHTRRILSWKPGQENKVLSALAVIEPDRTQYVWKQTSENPEQWFCNNGTPQPAHFEVKPDLTFIENRSNFRSFQEFNGRKVSDYRDRSRIEQGQFGITKVVRPDQLTVTFEKGPFRVTVEKIIESDKNGRQARTWTADRSGAYNDGNGNSHTGRPELQENGRYKFVGHDGIRHVYTPGQTKPETRGTASNFKQFLETVIKDQPSLYTWRTRIDQFDSAARKEGVQARLADIYDRLSDQLIKAGEIQDVNTKARELNRIISQELRPTRPMFYERTPKCSDAHAAQVEQALEQIPQQVRKLLNKNGYRVIATNTVGEAMPHADTKILIGSGERAITFGDAAGYHDPHKKEIVVAEGRIDRTTNKFEHNPHVSRTTYHEIGHALDWLSGKGQPFSQDPEFIQAFNTDVARMKNEFRRQLEYYIQSDPRKPNTVTKAGARECCAEALTFVLGGNRFTEGTANFKECFPEVMKVVQRKFGKMIEEARQ